MMKAFGLSNQNVHQSKVFPSLSTLCSSCTCIETLGMQRLNTMVSSLVLRRTKDDISSENFQLTKKMVTQHSVDLNEDEMAIHRYMYSNFSVIKKVYTLQGNTNIPPLAINYFHE